jgi:hypothetical protein
MESTLKKSCGTDKPQSQKELYHLTRSCGIRAFHRRNMGILLKITYFRLVTIGKRVMSVNRKSDAVIHHQGIICGVAFDRSFLRRIAPYASVVAPRRRASNTLMVIRAVA